MFKNIINYLFPENPIPKILTELGLEFKKTKKVFIKLKTKKVMFLKYHLIERV